MIFADISPAAFFGAPLVIIGCVVTFIAGVVGAILTLRAPSRATGLRILRIALCSIPFVLGLLLLVIVLDQAFEEADQPHRAANGTPADRQKLSP